MPVETAPQVVRFGECTLDLRSGELSRGGRRVLLPDQPFRLLLTLIRSRGQLVTRETLQHQLWSEDTFVDFEAGLNAAVKRVREALGDSAASTTFIETLPRRGYRFIAPVEVVPAGEGSTDEPAAPVVATTGPSPATAAGVVGLARPGRWWRMVALAAASIAVAIGAGRRDVLP